MPNSRSIPEGYWANARRQLIFFFAHSGMYSAEDLAQEVLARVLRREDYDFADYEEFLRVCYGFAKNVLRSARREQARRAAIGLEESHLKVDFEGERLNPAEMAILYDQAVTIGETQLRQEDWRLIQASASDEKQGPPLQNRDRVRLHRARKRLRRLLGWD